VSRDITTIQAQWASVSRAPSWLQSLGVAIVASALIAVCSHIALPLGFTPVPLTLQPFAVLLLGLLLAPRTAAGACLAYLAEGAAGLPVFAPTTAAITGVAHLLGPTGGYLLAYPAAAALISVLVRRSNGSYWAVLTSAAIGNLVILTCGALWLVVLTHASAQTVLSLAVLPFLPGDALKVSAAALLAVAWRRARRHAH
jgi:biotin transport system substrate-specific component